MMIINSTEPGDEIIAIEEVVIKEENPNGIIKDVWPKEKILKLLSNISENLPENDNLKYRSRVNKIDWDAVRKFFFLPRIELGTRIQSALFPHF